MSRATLVLVSMHPESLHSGEDVTLEELHEANRGLFIVYVMRDALKELWCYRHPGYALFFLNIRTAFPGVGR